MSSAPASSVAPCAAATRANPVRPNHPSAPSADTPRDDYSSARGRMFRRAILSLRVRRSRVEAVHLSAFRFGFHNQFIQTCDPVQSNHPIAPCAEAPRDGFAKARVGRLVAFFARQILHSSCLAVTADRPRRTNAVSRRKAGGRSRLACLYASFASSNRPSCRCA